MRFGHGGTPFADLTRLEGGPGTPGHRVAAPGMHGGDIQLTLFGLAEHPLLDKIRKTDPNSITPLDALQLIQQWQRELGPAGKK